MIETDLAVNTRRKKEITLFRFFLTALVANNLTCFSFGLQLPPYAITEQGGINVVFPLSFLL